MAGEKEPERVWLVNAKKNLCAVCVTKECPFSEHVISARILMGGCEAEGRFWLYELSRRGSKRAGDYYAVEDCGYFSKKE